MKTVRATCAHDCPCMCSLIVEVEGDKDSSVIPTTALVRAARLISVAESIEPRFVGDHVRDARWKLAHESWGQLKHEDDALCDEPVMTAPRPTGDDRA